MLDKVVLAIRFMALFSLAAGAVVLAGAVAASRYQRVREGALLRTLGARRPQLVRILLTEYAVLGALSAVAALLLSIAAGWALVRFVFEGRSRCRERRSWRWSRRSWRSRSRSGSLAAPRSGAGPRSRCCARSRSDERREELRGGQAADAVLDEVAGAVEDHLVAVPQ